MGRHAHKPDDKSKQIVEAMVAVGVCHEDIAAVIGIDDKTLRKHYREEIDTAAAKANAKVGQSLYQKAIGGDTTAQIWWTKARMRWSEKRELEANIDATVDGKWQVEFINASTESQS